ncbi:MAG: hypothetical protein JSR78_09335 [Proteobacteria bacterium]|nr:hypothetical protein [Pseudomonadota bacterium]
MLSYEPDCAEGGEATILGGLKTKNVDVVVTKEGLGPVMAVSCKGSIGAFRNLTNRMEEAVGDCTNLHITYPALVAGYLFVMRAHRQDAFDAAALAEPADAGSEKRAIGQNDIAIQLDGAPVESVVRFHNAVRELTGRRGIRNDVSRYEAAALALVDTTSAAGQVLSTFPTEDSPLRIERFFETLYQRYDERYVYSAPDLKRITRRREWSPASPIFDRELGQPVLDYAARISADVATNDED